MAMIDVRRFLIYHGNKQKNMTNEELISILRTLPMNAEVVVPVVSEQLTVGYDSVVEVVYNENGNIEIVAL